MANFRVPVSPEKLRPGRDPAKGNVPSCPSVLANITQLTALSLKDCRFPDEDRLEGLAALTDLQALKIPDTTVLPEVLQKLTSLTLLEIKCSSMTAAPAKYVAARRVAGIPVVVQPVAATMAPQMTNSLQHLSTLQRLQDLRVCIEKLPDADKQAVLGQIQQLPVLQHLDLTLSPTQALLQEPDLGGTFSDITTLESLRVQRGRFDVSSSLSGLTRLTCLTMDTCMLPAKLLLPMTKLQHLHLEKVNIPATLPSSKPPGSASELLAAIHKMMQLTYLALEHCQGTGFNVGAWPASAFGVLTSSTSLQELHVTLHRRWSDRLAATALRAMILGPQAAAAANVNTWDAGDIPPADIWQHIFETDRDLPALRVIKLHVRVPGNDNRFGASLQTIWRRFSNLQILDLQGLVAPGDPIEALFHLPYLQDLTVDCFEVNTLSGPCMPPVRATGLERLAVVGYHGVSEDTLLQLTHLRSLRDLRVDEVEQRPVCDDEEQMRTVFGLHLREKVSVPLTPAASCGSQGKDQTAVPSCDCIELLRGVQLHQKQC